MPKIPDQKLRKTPPGTAGPGAMGDPQPKALTKEMPYATPGNPESDMPADAMAHGYDTTNYDYSSEPLGAQILRRLHDDHCWLMSDYDSMLGPLEDKHVTKFLMEHLAHIEKSLSTIEKLWSKHERYSELPPLENAMQDEALDEEALDEELGEEGQLDPEYMEAPEEDLSTQTEQDLAMGEADGTEGEMPIDQLPPGDQDGVDTMDNDVVPAGSGAALPETPPDEAWEASQTRNKPQAKRLQTRRKSMCPTCKNMQCKCGTSCNTKNLNTVKPKEVNTREGTSKDQELSLGQEWTDSEKDTIFEAMDFLGEISQDNSPFDEESRMKSYHYHKTLDKMSKIKAYYKDEVEYEEKDMVKVHGHTPTLLAGSDPTVATKPGSKRDPKPRVRAPYPPRGKSGGDLPEHSDHRVHDEDYALRNVSSDLGIPQGAYGQTGGQVHGYGEQDAYDDVYEGYDPYEALVGGQQQNSMSTDQEQEAWDEAQDMHPHRLASREASDFFHRLAGERAFGRPHREEAELYRVKLSELLNNKAAPQPEQPEEHYEAVDRSPLAEHGFRDKVDREIMNARRQRDQKAEEYALARDAEYSAEDGHTAEDYELASYAQDYTDANPVPDVRSPGNSPAVVNYTRGGKLVSQRGYRTAKDAQKQAERDTRDAKKRPGAKVRDVAPEPRIQEKSAPQTSGLGGSPEGMDSVPQGIDPRRNVSLNKSLDSILDHQESQLEVLTKNLNSVLTLMKR